nr:hypothetical protein [Kibdelosporangium sp. MJ126-NF4]
MTSGTSDLCINTPATLETPHDGRQAFPPGWKGFPAGKCGKHPFVVNHSRYAPATLVVFRGRTLPPGTGLF